MKRDDFKTRVIFRKFKQGGDLIALFPDDIWDQKGNVASYQHIGQHGPASYTHVINATMKATPAECKPLKLELERMGYNLNIKQKRGKK